MSRKHWKMSNRRNNVRSAKAASFRPAETPANPKVKFLESKQSQVVDSNLRVAVLHQLVVKPWAARGEFREKHAQAIWARIRKT